MVINPFIPNLVIRMVLYNNLMVHVYSAQQHSLSWSFYLLCHLSSHWQSADILMLYLRNLDDVIHYCTVSWYFFKDLWKWKVLIVWDESITAMMTSCLEYLHLITNIYANLSCYLFKVSCIDCLYITDSSLGPRETRIHYFNLNLSIINTSIILKLSFVPLVSLL